MSGQRPADVGILPLSGNGDSEDLIDGTRLDASSLSPVLQLAGHPLSPSDSLLSDNARLKFKQWLVISVALAAFMNGSMMAAHLPVVVDFLSYRAGIVDDMLHYGCLLASSPLLSLVCIVPAVWLGHLDSVHAGLSLLIVAFLLWMGSCLSSASASLFAGGQRFAVAVFAQATSGVASVCGSVAVINIMTTAGINDILRTTLILVLVVFGNLGELFSLLLMGTSSLAGAGVGWQIAFCTLAALAALALGVVSSLRTETAKYSLKVQTVFPKFSTLIGLLQRHGIVFVCFCYALVSMASSLVFVLIPLWISGAHVRPPSSGIVTGSILASKSFFLLTALLLSQFERRSVPYAHWHVMCVSMLVLCLAYITFSVIDSVTSYVVVVVLPLAAVGCAVGQVELTIYPLLLRLLGDAGASHFGETRLLQVSTLLLAQVVTPLFGALLLSGVGFGWLVYVMAAILAMSAPLLICLKSSDPPMMAELDSKLLT